MTNVFDFIRAKDPRYSNPLFNFLNAGQQRRQNLNKLFNEIGNSMSQFVSPRGRDQVQSFQELHNMVSPVVAGGSSMQNMQQGNYGSAFMDVAGFAVPTAIVAKYGGKTALDAAKYLSETLALTSGGMKNIGENVYEQVIARMNQPGEMPVVGSNLGNIGHNRGPALEQTRPKFVTDYSPSYRAATELPQEKGTYQQMRSMLLDRGAKEDELIWSGFDKRFLNQDQVTKQELIDYLYKTTEDNMIDEIIEQSEGILATESFLDQDDLVERFVDQNLDEEVKYYLNEYRVEMANESMGKLEDLDELQYESVANAYGFPGVLDDEDQMLKWKEYLSDEFAGKDTIVDNDDIMKLFKDEDEYLDYTMDETMAREFAADSLREHGREMDIVDLRNNLGLQGVADVQGENYAPYADYFTPGAIDYSANRYAFMDPENIRDHSNAGKFTGGQGGHWGEDDVIVHTRTGFFPLATESGRAHHVGEIQSDWSQEVQSMIKNSRKNLEYQQSKLAELEEQANFKSGGIKEYQDQMRNLYKSQIQMEEDFLANPTLTKGETDTLGIGAKAEMRKNYMARDIGDEILEYFKTVGPEKFKEFEKEIFDFEYSQGKYKDSGLGKTPTEWMLEDRAGKFQSFAADHRQILDFIMNDANTSDFAKAFKNKEYTHYNSYKKGGDDESLTFKEAYDRITNESQDAQVLKDFDNKLAGGPTVGSTNKWVDFALKKELKVAINSGSEYLSLGSPKMVKEMTGGNLEGQEEFYGKIVPKRLDKLVKRFDKKSKVEVIKIQTGRGVEEVLAVKITDDLVNGIQDKGGIPIFQFLPGAVGLGGAGVLASQANQQEQPGGVLNQF